jgi:hypothetical protein
MIEITKLNLKFRFQHPLDVVLSVVLVEGGDANANETLTHGQDNDGKVYRTVLKFDLDEYHDSKCCL